MPVEFVRGDLFANRFGARALAHGCNCQGSMGAGIATGFRDRYPQMYAEYRRRCKAQPRLFNLGTQEGVWHARATYEAVEASLKSMREQADREGVTSIAIPRTGAGYGGLSWKKVRAIVEAVFGDWDGTLVVYEEFAPEGNEPPASPEE